MDLVEAAARTLVERHRDGREAEPDRSLLNYAESSRVDDWTLRSALVRLAQVDPIRASAVLELVRRCDGAFGPLVRKVQRHTVTCDRALTAATLDKRIDSYPDARVADIARLVRDESDGFVMLASAYAELAALDDAELEALPLLDVALELDALADVMATWAVVGPDDPPLDYVDGACARAFAALAELGVPRETGGPPGRRS